IGIETTTVVIKIIANEHPFTSLSISLSSFLCRLIIQNVLNYSLLSFSVDYKIAFLYFLSLNIAHNFWETTAFILKNKGLTCDTIQTNVMAIDYLSSWGLF